MDYEIISEDEYDGFTCFWKIENFTNCKYSFDLEISSQSFDVWMLSSKWHLQCHNYSNLLNVSLCNDGYGGSYNINYTIKILSRYGWFPMSGYSHHKFVPFRNSHGINIQQWDKLFDYENVYLPNNSLIISCHIWNFKTIDLSDQYLLTSRMLNGYSIQHFRMRKNCTLNPTDFIHITKEKEVKNESTQTDQITQEDIFDDKDDLLRLFTEKRFCYVTLRTVNKDFAVLKALLCSRSPVFCAMFEKNLKESKRNIVDIDDVDSGTLTLFLQFLHQEPVGDLEWEEAVKLYYAADKYQIEQLKIECVSQLRKKLTVDNVCEVFELSDMHQDTVLKQCAQEFFCKNSKAILRSTEWSNLVLNRTKLSGEILCVLAEKL